METQFFFKSQRGAQMKRTPISKRLKHIAQLVKPGVSIADIGTDHGYLPSYLLEHGQCTKVILSDVNKGPLENAKMTFMEYHPTYFDKTAFRLGSGIQTLEKGEVDCVVIAGMGGGLIQMILEDDVEKSLSFNTLILQPQTEQDRLREYILHTLKLNIAYEAFVEDAGKQYEMMVVTHEQVTTEETFDVFDITSDLEFGYRVLASELLNYKPFLQNKYNKYAFVLERLPDEAIHAEKREKLLHKIKTIHTLMEAIDVYEHRKNR